MVNLVFREIPLDEEILHDPLDGGDPQNTSLQAKPLNELPLISAQTLSHLPVGKELFKIVSVDVSEPTKIFLKIYYKIWTVTKKKMTKKLDGKYMSCFEQILKVIPNKKVDVWPIYLPSHKLSK